MPVDKEGILWVHCERHRMSDREVKRQAQNLALKCDLQCLDSLFVQLCMDRDLPSNDAGASWMQIKAGWPIRWAETGRLSKNRMWQQWPFLVPVSGEGSDSHDWWWKDSNYPCSKSQSILKAPNPQWNPDSILCEVWSVEAFASMSLSFLSVRWDSSLWL